MQINIEYNKQQPAYTLENQTELLKNGNIASENIDAKTFSSFSVISDSINGFAEKNGSSLASSVPALTLPGTVPDSAQLKVLCKEMDKFNQSTQINEVQAALNASEKDQIAHLIQQMQSPKKSDAFSATEISVIAGYNSILADNSSAVAGTKQVIASEASDNDNFAREAAYDGVVSGTNKSHVFNPQILANSRMQSINDNFDKLLQAQQKNKAANIQLKAKSSEIAYEHGKSSAAAQVKAGVDGRNQAITGGATSIGLSAMGGVMQYRGASKTIKAQTVHSTQANKLTQQANKFEAQAAATLNSDPLTGQNDAKILKQTALLKQSEAAKQSLEANRVSMLGNRQQANGNLVANIAGSMGQLTSAQYQVSQAEHQSESQLRMTDQQIINARAEAEERQAQNNDQMIREIMQQMAQVAERSSSNFNSLIRV
ncbi:hypothetical protein [Kalamiella sp. sgz302252]|uniref:hypothetical protein n=1 Tax=Pantoea sp. sgz302252 TaxID=3341827 RepID=UPI0036D3FB24